jgi:hypothetical protein
MPSLLDQAVSFFRQQAQTTVQNVSSDVLPWLQEAFGALSMQSEMVRRLNQPCVIVDMFPDGSAIRCHQRANVQCVVCQRLVCLDHAHLAKTGDAVCMGCVSELVSAHPHPHPHPYPYDPPGPHAHPHPHRVHNPGPGIPPWQSAPPGQPPPPPPARKPEPDPKKRAEARRLLEVPLNATLDQVKSALKKKLAAHHPDRGKTDAQKKKLEAEFKRIQNAYNYLVANVYERQAA